MTDEGAFPKSSLPSVQDFVDAIMPSVEAGRPAIVCTITSYFSGSYNSACTAKDIILEDHPDAKVTVINSLTPGLLNFKSLISDSIDALPLSVNELLRLSNSTRYG